MIVVQQAPQNYTLAIVKNGYDEWVIICLVAVLWLYVLKRFLAAYRKVGDQGVWKTIGTSKRLFVAFISSLRLNFSKLINYSGCCSRLLISRSTVRRVTSTIRNNNTVPMVSLQDRGRARRGGLTSFPFLSIDTVEDGSTTEAVRVIGPECRPLRQLYKTESLSSHRFQPRHLSGKVRSEVYYSTTDQIGQFVKASRLDYRKNIVDENTDDVIIPINDIRRNPTDCCRVATGLTRPRIGLARPYLTRQAAFESVSCDSIVDAEFLIGIPSYKSLAGLSCQRYQTSEMIELRSLSAYRHQHHPGSMEPRICRMITKALTLD